MFTWLSTWLLHPFMAVGAAAAASPILIHLLSRRRFRRVRWPAMEFLLAAHSKNRRRVRMEQLILLALRCLAILLMALALARPFVRPGVAAAILGGGARTERIILLDDSLSMTCADGDATVFDRGVDAVRRLARWIGAEAERDALSLYLFSNPAQPVVTLANCDDAALQQLLDRLAALRPTQRTGRPARAIGEVADMLRGRPTQAAAAVYVVSDFQRSEWLPEAAAAPGDGTPPRPADNDRADAGPLAPLTKLAETGRSVRLVLIDVSAASPGNLAVTDVRLLSPQIVAGVPTRVTVEVANYSGTDQSGLELAASVADQMLPPVPLGTLSNGGATRETLEVAFPRVGADYVRVALVRPTTHDERAAAINGVTLDDQRAAACRVLECVRVLVVNGDPNPDTFRDEVFLLTTALRPEGRAFSGNDVRVADEAELDTADLSDVHVVVLANVFRLTPTAVQSLRRYVAAGGGLLIFAGDQVDLDHYNEMLYSEGQGPLPAPLIELRSAPDDRLGGAYAPDQWDVSHPVFRSFSGPAAELLRGIRVTQFIAAQTETAAPTTAAASSAPAAPQPAPPTVLARLNDPDHSPLLIERGFGAGRALFVATTADLDWTNWPRDPSYVPFVLELASCAARRSEQIASFGVGDVIRLPLDPNRFAPRVAVQSPGSGLEAAVQIEARVSPDGGTWIEWEETEQSGVYAFDLTTIGGETQRQFASVNVDPREADLTPADRDELKRHAGKLPVEYVRDLAAYAGDAADSRRELWWPLLILAAAILMLEHALAWRFGARTA